MVSMLFVQQMCSSKRGNSLMYRPIGLINGQGNLQNKLNFFLD